MNIREQRRYAASFRLGVRASAVFWHLYAIKEIYCNTILPILLTMRREGREYTANDFETGLGFQ